jgi:DNA-directed RNA polymerase subunit M/transcription elongation factor TFIIS
MPNPNIIIPQKVNSKHCPKCGGFMYQDKDTYGRYENCANCGFLIDLEPIRMPLAKPSEVY